MPLPVQDPSDGKTLATKVNFPFASSFRIIMTESYSKLTRPLLHGFGWAKDHEEEHREWWYDIKKKVMRRVSSRECVDLRSHFPPIRDQGEQNTATSHACLSIIEYFENRFLGTTCERSASFLDSMTRESYGIPGNRGVPIGITLNALVRFGCPPTLSWPDMSEIRRFVQTPGLSAGLEDYRKLRFARLDYSDGSGRGTLNRCKICLAVGLPVLLGCEVHHESTDAEPFPWVKRLFFTPGWQTVVACGYCETRRCLLVRNSWGTNWGTAGYGWLPYAYVKRNHAADFWIVYRKKWLKRLLKS